MSIEITDYGEIVTLLIISEASSLSEYYIYPGSHIHIFEFGSPWR